MALFRCPILGLGYDGPCTLLQPFDIHVDFLIGGTRYSKELVYRSVSGPNRENKGVKMAKKIPPKSGSPALF